MTSKLVLSIWLMMLSRFTLGFRSPNFGYTEWSDTKINGWNDSAVSKIVQLFLQDELTTGHELIRQELVGSFLASVQACQSGLDEAERKLNLLFESHDLGDMTSENKNYVHGVGRDLIHGDIISSVDDEKENGDDIDNDVHINVEALEEELSSIFAVEENIVIVRPAATRDLMKILLAFRHACSSLPSAVPALLSRGKRSPQKNIQKVAATLTRWTELWANSIEDKINVFMTGCLNDGQCRAYLENVTEKLVQATKQSKNDALRVSSAILEELLQSFPHKTNPSMETLSHLQRAALHLGDSRDGLKEEEENAFKMAEKLSEGESGHIFASEDGIAAEKLFILSNLLRMNLAKTPSKQVPELAIETEKAVRKIPDTFLSLAVGSILIRENWKEIMDKLPIFLNLASSLSPSLFRVGGSHANFMMYDPSSVKAAATRGSVGSDPGLNLNFDSHVHHNSIHPKLQKTKHRHSKIKSEVLTSRNHPKSKQKTMPFDIVDYSEKAKRPDWVEDRCKRQLEGQEEFRNFTMTETDWKILVDLNRDLNWTLLFDLNQFTRDLEGNWDPTNAKLLFEDSLTSQIPIIWQLGNEPNSYWHAFGVRISPEQTAEDYRILRRTLKGYVNQPVVVVGPDVTRPKHVSSPGQEEDFMDDSMEFLRKFLQSGSEEINAVTWHHYYVNGKTTTLEDFLSPETLSVFPKQLQVLVSIRDELARGKPIWLTETASAWHGGAPDISNRFAGAIPWLDKLGAAALGGVSHVFKQTLYGGCYALLAPDLTPSSNFWVSVLHKQLVGSKVLLPRVRLAPDSLKLYAHCLNSKHPLFTKGSIVVFGINLSNFDQYVHLYDENVSKSSKFLYQISPPEGNLQSSDVWLNNRVLRTSADGTLPPLLPVPDTREGLNFSPWTMSFWVFPEVGAAAC